MATTQISTPNVEFTDKRRTARGGHSAALKAANLTNALVSNDAMDASLLASGLYSQARINQMTQNDKVYALRLIHDAGSF